MSRTHGLIGSLLGVLLLGFFVGRCGGFIEPGSPPDSQRVSGAVLDSGESAGHPESGSFKEVETSVCEEGPSVEETRQQVAVEFESSGSVQDRTADGLRGSIQVDGLSLVEWRLDDLNDDQLAQARSQVAKLRSSLRRELISIVKEDINWEQRWIDPERFERDRLWDTTDAYIPLVSSDGRVGMMRIDPAEGQALMELGDIALELLNCAAGRQDVLSLRTAFEKSVRESHPGVALVFVESSNGLHYTAYRSGEVGGAYVARSSHVTY